MLRKLYRNVVYIYMVIFCVTDKPPRNNVMSTTAPPLFDLLGKLHQNDYKLVFERSELVRSNKSFGEMQLRTFKFNRTTPVVNASFTYAFDLGNDVEIICQTYRFASNEYREFPLRFEFNLCEALAMKSFGLDKMTQLGNLSCPFVKGKKYGFYNWSPEEKSFPPLIPAGQYMMELQFVYHSQEYMVTNNYGTIYRPIN